jgi:predicted phosphodiesterase
MACVRAGRRGSAPGVEGGEGMKRSRVLRLVLAVGVGLPLLLVLVAQALSLHYYLAARRTKLPANVGNFPSNVASLAPKNAQDAIGFAVVGDTCGYGVLEEIVQKLNLEPIDFLALLGDMTYDSTVEDHRFFQTEMAAEMQPRWPVFYIPGNHDIGENFSLAQWEAVYGPSQFWFKYGGNLFIFMHIPHVGAENGSADAEKACDFLEGVLKTEARGAQRVFVFNHVPLPVGADWEGRKVGARKRLFDLLHEHHVNYFITGDYHGFAEVERDGTVFVVSGGGGSPLKGGALGFFHSVIFTVSKRSVQRRLLVVPETFHGEDSLERIVTLEVLPVLKRYLPEVLVADVAIIAVLFLLVRLAVRRRGAQG